MTDLVLDLTGSLLANKVSAEPHNVTLEVNRFFIPNKGAFYDKGLVIRNAATNALLQPVVDYSLYELEKDLTIQTGIAVYKVIHIHNELIAAVTVTYQAVGGDYQFTAAQLEAELGALLAGGNAQYPFGHVTGKPVNYAPELHLQDADTIYDANRLVMAVTYIGDTIRDGDRMATSQVFQYIDLLAQDFYDSVMAEVNSIDTRLNTLLTGLDESIGDYIITDNPINPAVRRGVGQYQLNPNILLYGAGPSDTIGTLIPLAAGSDINARRTYIWGQVEDTGEITYAMSASATNINEGASVTFTLTTTGLTSGTNIAYKITGSAGFTSGDIAGTPLNGNFVIGPDGIGTVTVTAAADMATEASESFKIALVAVAGVSRTVTINDTSKSPTVSMRYSANAGGAGTITTANEGTTVYLVITGTNLPADHEVTLDYALGSSNAGDFDNVRPTSATLSGASTIIPYQIKADRLTDGNKTLIVRLTSGLITTGVSASIALVDTSKTPTHNLYFSGASNGSGTITSVNEGASCYLVLTTTEVDPGTVFQLGYTSMNDADFTAARPTTVTVDSQGKAIIAYTPKANNTTDGNRTLGINLIKDSVILKSASITVNDTSQNPQYALRFTTASDGSGTPLSQINEGQSLYMSLVTTGVAVGTQYTIEYAGTATNADFTANRPAVATIAAGGKYIVGMTVKNDFTSENTETMIVNIKQGSTIVASASINIMDTSVNANYSFVWSSSSSGTPTVTSVNEGQTVYLVATATNVPVGTTLDLAYPTGTGKAVAADFATNRPINIVLNNQGKGSASFTLKNDNLAEGTEMLSVVITRDGDQVGTKDLNINDTSIPKLTARFSASNAGTGTVTSVDEGGTVYLIVDAVGYTPGQLIDFKLTGIPDNEIAWDNIWGAAAGGSIALGNDMRIVAKITIKANRTTNAGGRTITATAHREGEPIDGPSSATTSITVNDTSKTPTYKLTWSSDASGTPEITNSDVNTQAYLILTTTNLPNGYEVLLKWAGSSYQFGNYANPVSATSMTINNGRSVLPVDLTLKSAGYAFRFGLSTDMPVLGVDSVNEGQTFYLYSESNSAQVGNKVYLGYTQNTGSNGTVNAADFNGTWPTELEYTRAGWDMAVSGWATFTAKNDNVTDLADPERLIVDIYSDAAKTDLLYTAQLNINDTSTEPEVVITLSGTASDINLLDQYTAIYGAPTSTTRCHFVISNTATITASATNKAAITVGTWPSAQCRRLTNNGKILGHGGNGGSESWSMNDTSISHSVSRATDGGPAIKNDSGQLLTITNNGFIASGGGGGGKGQGFPSNGFGFNAPAVSAGVLYSGFGGGAAVGGLGSSYNYWDSGSDTTATVTSGNGTNTAGGAGSRSYGTVSPDSESGSWYQAGYGGAGGAPGEDGNPGYAMLTFSSSSGTPANTIESEDPDSIGGRAGLIYNANVFINNLGSGSSRGRTP